MSSPVDKEMCDPKTLTISQNVFSLGVSIYITIVSILVVNDIREWREHTSYDGEKQTDMSDDGVEHHDMMGLAITTLVGGIVYALWNGYFTMKALCDENFVRKDMKDKKESREVLLVSGFQTVVVLVLLVLYCLLWGGFEEDRQKNDPNLWQGERTAGHAGSGADLPSLTLAAWIALGVNLLTCFVDLGMYCKEARDAREGN